MSTIQDYLRVLREQWLIVVVAALVALLGAGATWSLRPPQYTANLTMYVWVPTADAVQAAYQGGLLSQERVKSYVSLVSSPKVSAEVIRLLGLSATPDQLAQQITASSETDSVLIDVAVSGGSPQQVADIANAVGGVFTGLVNDLERPSTPNAEPAVAVRVVQAAAPPTKPSSTALPNTLTIGLLVGLVVGVGGAFARNALDTSVKSLAQLRADAKAPNLGNIGFDTGMPERALVVLDDPHSPRTEEFRQLRTNLQFVDVDNPRKVIAVTSSTPSEGKTTTVISLAVALVAAGQRVLVIEADLRRPKVADLLGLERTVGLTSVLTGRVRTEQAIQHLSGVMDVLTSGPLPPNPSELLASQPAQVVLREVRARYDTVLIDTPPLLPVTDAAAITSATDGAILVCRFKTNSDQVRRAVAALEAVSARLLGTVFTMVPSTGPRAFAQYFPSSSPNGAAANASLNGQAALREPPSPSPSPRQP